jgi:hypothetical protein
MIRISAAVLALALAACDASPFAATAPMDDGADVGSLDGERGADTSMGVGGDTWQAVGAGTFWPCGPGYELARYSNPGTWCNPIAGVDAGQPCAVGNPINWAGGGVVRCADAVAVDGGTVDR